MPAKTTTPIPSTPRQSWHHKEDEFQITMKSGQVVSYPTKPQWIQSICDYQRGLYPGRFTDGPKVNRISSKSSKASLRRIGKATKASLKSEQDAIAAAEKAKKEAAAKRKAELSGLSVANRKLVRYLESQPDAFGCQRKHVLEVIKALTGVDFPALLVKES